MDDSERDRGTRGAGCQLIRANYPNPLRCHMDTLVFSSPPPKLTRKCKKDYDEKCGHLDIPASHTPSARTFASNGSAALSHTLSPHHREASPFLLNSSYISSELNSDATWTNGGYDLDTMHSHVGVRCDPTMIGGSIRKARYKPVPSPAAKSKARSPIQRFFSALFGKCFGVS